MRCLRRLTAGIALITVAGLASAACGAGAPAGNKTMKYSDTIKHEPGLLGYWPLSKSTRASAGSLALKSTQPRVATAEGPFGGACVDLSRGNDLVIEPHPALDGAQLSVELIFRIQQSQSGNPCLFGLRRNDGARFSLHYAAGGNQLLLWNGSSVVRYQCNDDFVEKEWYHVALSIDGSEARAWLQGKPCAVLGKGGPAAGKTGFPFVVGSVAAGSGADHAPIAVAHLALYDRPLDTEQILRHMAAAGWMAKTRVRRIWQDCPVSILESQIGYHPRNVKRVYLRSAQEHPPREFLPAEFTVVEPESGKEVFRGPVQPWGRKWESCWWVLDFTPVRAPGTYCVQAGELTSSAFRIADGIYGQTGLGVIALDQLEKRIHLGKADSRKGLPGIYVDCGPDVRIYMDCGSPYAELEPVGTCVYALIELHEKLGERFEPRDRERMIDLAALGADYFVAAQRHTDDPETDGMFHHSLLVHSEAWWAGRIFTYLDTAYGVALLARAHQFFRERDPERAARYLAAAEKAWKLCVRRPYHTRADRTFPEGCNAYFWNAPVGIQDTFGRCLYNIKDPDWKMPDVLRTRDRLPFVKGSALLYEITGRPEYLEKAVEFGDAILERQFTDWEHPIEGCYGNFYEFPGNDQAFFHEFMQGGFWWEGNVEALNLDGFVKLLQLAPDHPRAAAWQNAIRTYVEHYATRATALNPLGIYPVACYRDPDHGGIKNFQNMLMGSSCLFGFSAKNFMTLGEFLENADLQCQAMAGVNFIAGLNPGVPNAYRDTAWDARTLILGVGNSWFGPAGEPTETARGSVPNGFCAAPQFWLPDFVNFLADQPDKPAGLINEGGGLQFNEGWILHSHAYVQAVARLEAPYTLRVQARNNGRAVAATIGVNLRESAAPHAAFEKAYRTGRGGKLSIADLPTPCAGEIRLTYKGRSITRPLAAIAGATHDLEVDFAREASVALQAPDAVTAGRRAEVQIAVENQGTAPIDLKLALTASGVTLDRQELSVSLAPGAKQALSVGFTAGDRVMPYLVRARIAAGAPARAFQAAGRIASASH